jgi:hypothetical protein
VPQHALVDHADFLVHPRPDVETGSCRLQPSLNGVKMVAQAVGMLALGLRVDIDGNLPGGQRAKDRVVINGPVRGQEGRKDGDPLLGIAQIATKRF